jgi:glycosyltransferase involved in cell wall biosynthesis
VGASRVPPRFSIVTATRNDLEGLLRTWRSLAAQTDDRFEWVVVDGASRDGSVEWLSGLGDARVRWTSVKDSGIYDAMNSGMRRSNGDLLMFLGAGDTLAAPSVLATVSADQTLRRWRWGYGIVRVLDAKGALVQVASFVPFRRRLLELGYHALCHQACFFTRDLVAQVGWYDPEFGLHADQDFCIRAARIGDPGVIGEIVADFEQVGASSTLPADSFVRAARGMRRNAREPVGGNDVADATVTAMLSAELRARTLLGRWARRR